MNQKAKKIIILAIAFLAIASFLWWSFVIAETDPCAAGGFWDESAGVCIYPQNTSAPALPPESRN